MNAVMKDPPPDDLRQELHALAERLPEGAAWADVQEYARFRAAVEAGIAAADRGEFASAEEVRRMFAKWGVEFED
jgi:predicted transcriptional regulator